MASTSTETQKSDPALLGVNIPLSVTVSAAKQVGAAWQKFGVDLVQAVAAKREAKAPAKKAKEAEAAESSASASAGVSA